jgi:hypothetical protein
VEVWTVTAMFFWILQLAAFWMLAGIFLLSEYLDWFGRLDVLEVKHPKIYRFLIGRPVRVVLLLLVFGLLAENTKEVVTQLEGEQNLPPMKFVAPQPPVISKTAPEFVESNDSLRRRTLRLADEFYSFVRERQERHPPYGNLNDPNPSEETKKKLALDKKYDQETQDQYNRLYQDRFIGIIREYQAKGVPVGWLENSARNGNLQWFPPGADWEATPSDQLTAFRDLAYRVDAQDNLIVLSY